MSNNISPKKNEINYYFKTLALWGFYFIYEICTDKSKKPTSFHRPPRMGLIYHNENGWEHQKCSLQICSQWLIPWIWKAILTHSRLQILAERKTEEMNVITAKYVKMTERGKSRQCEMIAMLSSLECKACLLIVLRFKLPNTHCSSNPYGQAIYHMF